MVLRTQHGRGIYIYENGARFEGEFEDDREIYASDEQKMAVRESMDRLFVIHTEDLEKDVNVAQLEKVVMRHWQFLRNMASSVYCLGKVWLLIDLMQCKETKSTYEISKTVMSSTYTVYPGKTVDVTDSDHRFAFRQFLRILLRLSVFSSQSAEMFVGTLQNKAAIAGNMSMAQYFWKRMSEPFKSSWLDTDVRRLFEERYETVADALSEVEAIEERVTATYIDGGALKRIMDEVVTEPILRGIVREQFELCYYSRAAQPMMLEERETECEFAFEAIRFLKHECKMFFVLLISIKVAHDAMLSELERIQREKEEAESEELAQQKGKKSSKKDKKAEPEPDAELSEDVQEEVKELSLITVTMKHVQSVFAQIKC